MRSSCLLLLVACIVTATLHAQDDDQLPSLHLGDPAPALQVQEWIKGKPIQHFKKGQVYVIEFWGTWCAPCRAEIPHMSALAEKYRRKVTFIGIDAYEPKRNPIAKVKAFVDSMGSRMNYEVAVDDNNKMVESWLKPLGEPGFPGSIVVNGAGKIAWAGHPRFLDAVLPNIVNNTWDIKEALAQRNLDRYLDSLNSEASYLLIGYRANELKPDDKPRPDLALLVIDSIVNSEPRLKYAPQVVFETFASLLTTDVDKAYEYGKAAIAAPTTFKFPACEAVVNVITLYSDKLDLPPQIYQLGAEACQKLIDWHPYPEIIPIHKEYAKMAEWYVRANKRSEAIAAQEKAVEILRSKRDFSATDLAALEARLQQYKNH